MLNETLALANSFGMWVACGVVVLIVALQSIIFFRYSIKTADTIKFDRKMVFKSFKSGMLTALGPSIAMFVALVSFISVIGSPMAFENLSIVGSAATDLSVANIAAESAGSALGNASFTPRILAIVAFCLALNGAGWQLVVLATAKNMDKIRTKLGGGDERWIKVISVAASVGVFCNQSAGQAINGGAKLVAVLAGIIVMLIITKIADKLTFLKEYKMAISIICGVTCAGIAAAIL